MSTKIAFRLPRCVLSPRQRRFLRPHWGLDLQVQGERPAKYKMDISRHINYYELYLCN